MRGLTHLGHSMQFRADETRIHAGTTLRGWFGLLCLTAMIAVSHPVQHARASGERAFEVVLEQGAPAREQTTLKARVGDAVTLTVHSDEAVTLHLHGYDRELMVPAGGKSSLRLDARIPGRFPIESHDAHGHGALLYLEVRPD